MAHNYDPTNIFARILRGEIPAKTILETAHTLVFRDITPQAPDHVLVIPKGAYASFDHFGSEATEAEIVDFYRTAAKICEMLGASLATGGLGYRAITNAGDQGGQEVPHYHLHIVAGCPLGRMLEKR